MIEGTEISLEPNSPKPNHENNAQDRKVVVGERCLNISDRVALTRRAHQQIESTPFVEFPDGVYTLTAKVKNTDGFEKLTMYAKSAGNEFVTPIDGQNSEWNTIRVDGIKVSDNTVEVGFFADGNAEAFCRIDDVTLVLEN